jgi:N-acyl homoserine lactone hydrolase
MNAPTPITITPIVVADQLAEGDRMPVYAHVIDHPDARVLVDTGTIEQHPRWSTAADRVRRLRARPSPTHAGVPVGLPTQLGR